MASSNRRTNNLKNPYGIKNGRFVHVDEVESGLACDCTCPFSDAPLVARKGEQGVRHHFARSTSSEKISLESFFHRLAKQLLEDLGKITLPASNLTSQRHPRMEVVPARSYTVSKVATEKAIPSTSFIADNIVQIEGKEIVIEWRYSHECEAQKVSTIRKIRIPTVEIDIRDLDLSAPLSEQAEWILHKASRQWVYDSRIEANKLRRWGLRMTSLRCSEYVRYFETTDKTFGIRDRWVHKCPRYRQTVAIHECRACPYMWGTNIYDTEIECTGASTEKVRDKLKSHTGCNVWFPRKWGNALPLSQIPKDAIRKWKGLHYVEIVRPSESEDLTLEIDDPF